MQVANHGRNLVKKTAMENDQSLVKNMEYLKKVLKENKKKMVKFKRSRMSITITMIMVSQFLLFYRTGTVAIGIVIVFLN
jgi:hypothetical protein